MARVRNTRDNKEATKDFKGTGKEFKGEGKTSRFANDSDKGRTSRYSKDSDKSKTPRYAKDSDKSKTPRYKEEKNYKRDEKKYKEEDKKYKKPNFINDYEEETDENINLVEGRNPVLEAIKSGREIDKLFIQKGASEGSIRQIIAMAKERNILIKEVDRKKLDTLSTTNSHQGVIASVALYKYYEVDEILEIAKKKEEDPFIIILDEITDNTNLGSILRIADAAGVHGIIIPKRRSASLTPVIAKTSAGAIEYVPVAKVTNLNQTMEVLKKKGVWIVGADMKGHTYYDKDMSGPVALVIGSEGEGIGRLIKENCDFLVSIPMKGKISSLNAAVSTGIIVYEINKQRTAKGIGAGRH